MKRKPNHQRVNNTATRTLGLFGSGLFTKKSREEARLKELQSQYLFRMRRYILSALKTLEQTVADRYFEFAYDLASDVRTNDATEEQYHIAKVLYTTDPQEVRVMLGETLVALGIVKSDSEQFAAFLNLPVEFVTPPLENQPKWIAELFDDSPQKG
jgi:hypothetical protein